jgi:broad specificity phosphatase PhoE
MTRIAIMRHFPTSWNREHRLQGQTDIPLTDEARQELHGLVLPAPWDTARIIASPLSRALETARILAQGRPVASDPRLVEIGYGEWEGQHGADLLADPNSGYVNVEDGGWHRRPPGGESHWDAWQRVLPALIDIAASPAPALLIIHRALMRVLLARAWDWNYDVPEPFRIKRGRIYPLTLLPDGTPTAPEEPARLEPVP